MPSRCPNGWGPYQVSSPRIRVIALSRLRLQTLVYRDERSADLVFASQSFSRKQPFEKNRGSPQVFGSWHRREMLLSAILGATGKGVQFCHSRGLIGAKNGSLRLIDWENSGHRDEGYLHKIIPENGLCRKVQRNNRCDPVGIALANTPRGRFIRFDSRKKGG